MSDGVGEWLDAVAAARKGEIESGVTQKGQQTTPRELLDRFGRERRGRWVVADIRSALEERRLRTEPDFQFVWIDAPILIVMDIDADRKIPDPTIRVRMLDAANRPPVSVKRDDPLAKATTIMRLEDYSQLPVMPNEREVKGVVSWKSIGAAHAEGKSPSKVRDCMVVDAPVIDIQLPLAEATDLISQHDYVLVRGGKERKITGIVTAVDLAHQFKERTHPFLLIGEIEHHLRSLIHGKFSADELVEAADGDERVRRPDDLTFGGYCRLLQRKDWWARLKLQVDHAVFKERLETVRQIRNAVMHFSPQLPGASEIRQLESMARFCGTLAPYGSD